MEFTVLVPGKNSGGACHALLQGIFPTQGWNPGLPQCRWILDHLWATREAHECWSGLPFLSPVDLPDPRIEPGSPALQVDSLAADLPDKAPYLPICQSNYVCMCPYIPQAFMPTCVYACMCVYIYITHTCLCIYDKYRNAHVYTYILSSYCLWYTLVTFVTVSIHMRVGVHFGCVV